MDNQDSGIIAIVGLVLSVGTAVIGAINHKRIRSTCCGKKAEASLDIERVANFAFVTPASFIRTMSELISIVELSTFKLTVNVSVLLAVVIIPEPPAIVRVSPRVTV